MLVAFLAKLMSPRVLLGIFVAFLIAIAGFICYRTAEKFISLEKQNTSLEQNLSITKSALSQEQQSVATQTNVYQSNINSIRLYNSQTTKQLAQTQSDLAALQALGTPTNEDNKCMSSPYVSTILNRMRQHETIANNSNSGSNDNANSSTGVNNAGS